MFRNKDTTWISCTAVRRYHYVAATFSTAVAVCCRVRRRVSYVVARAVRLRRGWSSQWSLMFWTFLSEIKDYVRIRRLALLWLGLLAERSLLVAIVRPTRLSRCTNVRRHRTALLEYINTAVSRMVVLRQYELWNISKRKATCRSALIAS